MGVADYLIVAALVLFFATLALMWWWGNRPINAGWPRWALVFAPLVFLAYLAAWKSITIWQMKRDAKRYDARPPTYTGRAYVGGKVIDGQVVKATTYVSANGRKPGS